MAGNDDAITAVVDKIAKSDSWNKRVALIRAIPESFGKLQHQTIYARVAEASYVSDMAPDFAYVHWREGYELHEIEEAYKKAFDLTEGFTKIGQADIE